jgi:hypothetical protein
MVLIQLDVEDCRCREDQTFEEVFSDRDIDFQSERIVLPNGKTISIEERIREYLKAGTATEIDWDWEGDADLEEEGQEDDLEEQEEEENDEESSSERNQDEGWEDSCAQEAPWDRQEDYPEPPEADNESVHLDERRDPETQVGNESETRSNEDGLLKEDSQRKIQTDPHQDHNQRG